MVLAALVAAACSTGEGVDGGGAEPTASAAVAPATSPASLPADAGAADIARAVEEILGASTDPRVSAAALVDLPPDVPVPADTVVTEFHTSTVAQSSSPTSPATAMTETRIVLWTPADPADVATLYRTALPGRGFVEVGVSEPEQLDRTQSLEFESAAAGDESTLSVLVFDIAAGVADERVDSPTYGTQVGLSFVVRDDRAVGRYPWWQDLVPVPVRSTQRTAIDIGYHEPLGVVSLTATLEVDGDVTAVADAFRTEIGEPGPSTATTMDGGATFTGDDPELGTVVYTIEPGAGESATSDVTIAACVPIDVEGDDLRVTSQYLFWSSCEQSIGAAPPEEFVPPTTEPAELRAVTGRSASGEELRDAAAEVLGPTDDVVAAMASMAALPDALATPAGTDIAWFSTAITLEEGGWSTADVELVVDGTVEDVATFYETTLAAAGYFRMIGERTGTGADEQAQLQFTLEDGGFDDVAEIIATIGGDALIYADPPATGTPVRLSFTRPVVDQGELAADTWALPLAGVDPAAVTEWSVALNLVPDVDTVDLRTAYAVAGDAPAAMEAIRADPPPGVPLSSTDGLQPDTVWFERPGYESFWVSEAMFMSGDHAGIQAHGSLPLDEAAG